LTFAPSKYQQAIFDWVETSDGSSVVEAVAGSGKTTTIIEALNHIPGKTPAIFLAFNRAIAEELKERIPEHAVASTFHSAGFRAWAKKYPGCKVDDKKIWKLIRKHLSGAEIDAYGVLTHKLIELGRNQGIGVTTDDEPASWEQIITHYGLGAVGWGSLSSGEIEERAIKAAQMILQESVNQSPSVVDFDDMLYMPLWERMRIGNYPWVFVDEAQDTNPVRREMAVNLLRPGGRLVAVGDRSQAIYGFTGADSNAMDLIQRAFATKTLPLSICYRSGRLIVERARAIVPQIEASPTVPEGIVADTSFKLTPPYPDDVILCRLTSPLVKLAYTFIGEGKGCRVLGRDIGEGLIKLAEQLKPTNVLNLSRKLDEHLGYETERLTDREAQLQSLRDKVDCLQVIIGHLGAGTSLDNLYSHVRQLFTDSGGKVLTLSTIHKAKGLEWNRVYVYLPGLMPLKWAKQDWELQQERNLQYVAITRAKRELYFVCGIDKP